MLASVATGGAVYGGAVITRHRAQAAADLAALAAAGELGGGPEQACATAAEYARAMGAGIANCVVEQLDVTIAVRIPVSVGRWQLGVALALARAGPLDGG